MNHEERMAAFEKSLIAAVYPLSASEEFIEQNKSIFEGMTEQFSQNQKCKKSAEVRIFFKVLASILNIKSTRDFALFAENFQKKESGVAATYGIDYQELNRQKTKALVKSEKIDRKKKNPKLMEKSQEAKVFWDALELDRMKCADSKWKPEIKIVNLAIFRNAVSEDKYRLLLSEYSDRTIAAGFNLDFPFFQQNVSQLYPKKTINYEVDSSLNPIALAKIINERLEHITCNKEKVREFFKFGPAVYEKLLLNNPQRQLCYELTLCVSEFNQQYIALKENKKKEEESKKILFHVTQLKTMMDNVFYMNEADELTLIDYTPETMLRRDVPTCILGKRSQGIKDENQFTLDIDDLEGTKDTNDTDESVVMLDIGKTKSTSKSIKKIKTMQDGEEIFFSLNPQELMLTHYLFARSEKNASVNLPTEAETFDFEKDFDEKSLNEFFKK